MSTRVEKGGQKFKPVLKSKSRQTSLTSSADNRARHSVEPTQSSPNAGSQGFAPTEPSVFQDVSAVSTLVPSSVSIQPNVTSSPSKLSGIPIVISDPRTRPAVPIVRQRDLHGSAVVSRPAPTASTAAAPDTQSSSDKRQEITTPKQGSTSQKQPKQALLDAQEKAKKDRPTRSTRQAAVEETTEVETEPKRKAQKSPSEVGEHHPSKRQRSELSSREKSAQADGEGQSVDGSMPKRRRRHKTSAEDEESSAEPIDPTHITMRAICDDLGSGRKSSRWESSQTLYGEARKRAKEERARHILETEQQERETGRSAKKGFSFKPPLLKEAPSGNAEHGEDHRDDFSYTEALKTSHYAPQVRIGANGEIVLDADSLQVDRSADPDLVEEYSHIEENDHSKFTNSSSWSKRRLVRWGKEDTALFYDALRQFGQNFDLIARILPGKTYRMCKNKFKAEDKKNPALIDEALRNAVAVDLNTLSRMTGKDFTGPTPTITARSTLTLGDAEDSTTSRQPGNNATEIANSEAQDGQQEEMNPESAIALSASESIFATSRPSESPPPADTLLSVAEGPN